MSSRIENLFHQKDFYLKHNIISSSNQSVDYWKDMYEYITKYTHTLEEKLRIAEQALVEYGDKGNWADCISWNGYMEDSVYVQSAQFGENGYTIAEEALNKIRS